MASTEQIPTDIAPEAPEGDVPISQTAPSSRPPPPLPPRRDTTQSPTLSSPAPSIRLEPDMPGSQTAPSSRIAPPLPPRRTVSTASIASAQIPRVSSPLSSPTSPVSTMPPAPVSRDSALSLLSIPIAVGAVGLLIAVGFSPLPIFPIVPALPIALDMYRGKSPNITQAVMVWFFSCIGLGAIVGGRMGFLIIVACLLATSPIIIKFISDSLEPPPTVSEAYPPPETQSSAVGWVNDALRALFPIVSPDVLTPCIDLIEDALMQQVPPIISSVRMSSVSLGSEPLLLTSLRAMTTEEWMTALSHAPQTGTGQSYSEETAELRKRDLIVRRIRGQKRKTAVYRSASAGIDEPDDVPVSDLDQEPEDIGKFVNYEIGFAYKHTAAARARGLGLHAVANFGTGIKNVGGFEMPVFVDVVELRGKVMVRLLLSAQPPFVRDATVTFSSMPEFEISARPLRSLGFGSVNAFKLPLLKQYLLKSIATVAAAFVRPNTYSLDVDRVLLGGESAMRTNALGVFYVQIHKATNLRKTDALGLSDPYVSVSFSKFNRPVFSTRTIVRDLNPVWEEPCFVVVSEGDVIAGEKLRLRVCDSDRVGTDDVVGVVEVDVPTLLDQSLSSKLKPGELMFRRDELAPERLGMKTQGSLEWSVRFFPVWKMSREQIQNTVSAFKDNGKGQPLQTPAFMSWLDQYIEKTDWEAEKERRQKSLIKKYAAARHREEVEASLPPTTEMPSGILQFTIHQADELVFESLSGTWSGSSISRRKSAASGKPALNDVIDRAAWDTTEPPSPYVEVIINSKIVYRTRTKNSTPLPSWGAVSERFVRDWRQATVAFAVRDYRSLEHAPLLGVVYLRLKDVFKQRSQVTQWYPILGGLGWGRLRVSLLFKPIDIPLPRGVSAYDVVTLQVTHLSSTNMLIGGHQPSIVIETEYDRLRVPPPDDVAAVSTPTSKSSKQKSSQCHSLSRPASPASASSTPSDVALEWKITRPIRLAVMFRHSCSVVLSLATARRLKTSKVHALATVRLDDCSDSEEVARTVPVFDTTNIRDAMHAAQAYAAGQHKDEEGQAKLLGFINIHLIIHPGFSRIHRKFTNKDGKIRGAYETWEATRALTSSAPAEVDTDDDERSYSSEEDEDDDDDSSTPASLARAQMHDDDTRAILQDRNSHGKALRKANRGLFSVKIARTANFAYDKAKERILATGSKTDIQRRPHGADIDVEREGERRL